MDKYQRVEVVDYDAPGMGGEQTKLPLRPPEEYDIEDDTKEIEVDDLYEEFLKLAQNEGLDPTAVEGCIRNGRDEGTGSKISERDEGTLSRNL